MGHTSLHREKGLTDREFWTHELNGLADVRYEILDCATIDRVFYAAVRHIGGPRNGQVFGLVCTQQWTRDHYNFTFKDMDETCGPAYAKCPDRILDLLSPTDEQWALEWRAACRAYNAARAARPKVKRGDTVTFAQAMRFTNGIERDTFTFLERNEFSGGDYRVRIPGWRDRAYTVTPAAAMVGA